MLVHSQQSGRIVPKLSTVNCQLELPSHRRDGLRAGPGSNMQAIIDACKSGKINGEVALVLGVKDDAPAMERARSQGIPTVAISPKAFETTDGYDDAVFIALQSTDDRSDLPRGLYAHARAEDHRCLSGPHHERAPRADTHRSAARECMVTTSTKPLSPEE